MGSRLPLADAIARVELLSDAAAAPVVSTLEVTELVLSARTPDAEGNRPSDDGYTDTFDVNRAVTAVFDLKASRVSAKFDLNVDGQDLSRSQQYQHFVSEAARWRQKQAFTWPL